MATPAPVEVLVSGTTYRYIDDDASPRRPHTWSVARKVNGVTSTGNPSASGTVKAIAPMLSKDGGRTVVFLNPDVDAEQVGSSDIHYILGDAPPVMVTQSIRGYEGSVAGILASNVVAGLSADDMLANLDWYRRNPGQVLTFTWVSRVISVVIRNVVDQPIPLPDGTVEYMASFEFFEVF